MENDQGLAVFGALFGAYSFVCIIAMIIGVVSMWKLFTKAGKPGWAAIIPFYNLWVMSEIIYGDGKGWKFLCMLIPVVGFVVIYILFFRLAQVFGKGTGFCILNTLIPIVGMPIMAFNGDQYTGKTIESFL